MPLYYEDPSKEAELAGELVRLLESGLTHWDDIEAHFANAGYSAVWITAVLRLVSIKMTLGILKPIIVGPISPEDRKAQLQAILSACIDKYRMSCPDHKHVVLVFSTSQNVREQLRVSYEARNQMNAYGQSEPKELTDTIDKLEQLVQSL